MKNLYYELKEKMMSSNSLIKARIVLGNNEVYMINNFNKAFTKSTPFNTLFARTGNGTVEISEKVERYGIKEYEII